jgi:hypothetical protein
MRRLVAVFAVVVGAGLIVIPLAYSMFDRTETAKRILQRFTFLTEAHNPARYLAEAETTRAGSSELVGVALPRLMSASRINDGAFHRLLQTRFPALAAAQVEVPRANGFSVRYSKQLRAVENKFGSVYSIPVSGVSLTTVPWLLLLAGAACLASGVVLFWTERRAAAVAIVVLGLVMVVGPIALRAPWKAADGEDVKAFAVRGLTARAASAAHEASTALNALVSETRTAILPYLAQRRQITQRQLGTELNRDFPAAGRLIASWGTIGPRLARLSDAVSQSVDEFRSAKKLPISFPVWVLIGGGLALAVSAGVALLPGRRRPDGRA